MENSNTYYLNTFWKWSLITIGVVGFVFFGGMVGLTIMQNPKGLDVVEVILMIFFLLLPLELIYEGLRSRIEVSKTELVYYQPRFCLVCKWENLIGLLYPGKEITLKFSDANILFGKLAVFPLRLIGPWHRSVPLTPYLSRENRMQIGECVSHHLNRVSDLDKDILKGVLGIQT